MKLIGIAGKAGVGKDTAADYLVKHFGFLKYNLAGPIKAMLEPIVGPGAQWNDREWKEGELPWLGKSPRRLAQTLGTEWGRDLVHKNLWLLLAERTIARVRENNTDEAYAKYAKGESGYIPPQVKGIVIPDIRFENEAEWLRAQGGVLWHIVRRAPAVEGHISEAGVAIADDDAVIHNHGSIFDLHDTVRWSL